MKYSQSRNKLSYFSSPICFLVLFILFTIGAKVIDVQPIGPEESLVGYASFNGLVHNLVGENLLWYTITDYLGFYPLIVAFCFAIIGLVQWIKRRSFLKVDTSILIMGAFYLIVIFLYVFFEKVIINYRPVILESSLEASYPSSHTMITICILGMAIHYLKRNLKSSKLNKLLRVFLLVVIVITVFGRLISGVHWITDIIGGLLISFSVLEFYKKISIAVNNALGKIGVQ